MSALLHPEWLLPAAGVLLGAAIALGLARRRALRRLRRLMGERAAPSGLARDAALLLAFAALLGALAGPLLAQRQRLLPASGIDLVLLVDVSRSMDAADTPPSRLARALRAADQVLAGLGPGDRAAVAAFAGRGVLLTPLTPDHEALRELLSGLDTELIQPRGSALSAGLSAALAAYEAGSERPRLLLVLSDGEDQARGRELPLGELGRAGVRVLAAGFGHEAGAMLPDHGVPLLDAGGLPVVTRRSLAPLLALAQATGGEVFRADAAGSLSASGVVAALRRDAGRAGGFVVRREPAPLVLPLAALAFALLLLEGLPAPHGLLRRRRALAATALLLLAAGPLDREDALRLQRTGLARLEGGDLEGAARTLRAAALATRESELAALAYYHLGVAHLAAGELEQAKLAFFDSLALAPEDEIARFDLEWTLAALARRPPPARAAGEPQPQKQPAPSPQAPPRAEAEPEPGQRRERSPTPPSLSGDDRRRLLNRVPDDPSRALRLRARSDPGGATARPEGPAW